MITLALLKILVLRDDGWEPSCTSNLTRADNFSTADMVNGLRRWSDAVREAEAGALLALRAAPLRGSPPRVLPLPQQQPRPRPQPLSPLAAKAAGGKPLSSGHGACRPEAHHLMASYALGFEDWTEDDEGEFHEVLLTHNDAAAFDWASFHLYTVRSFHGGGRRRRCGNRPRWVTSGLTKSRCARVCVRPHPPGVDGARVDAARDGCGRPGPRLPVGLHRHDRGPRKRPRILRGRVRRAPQRQLATRCLRPGLIVGLVWKDLVYW